MQTMNLLVQGRIKDPTNPQHSDYCKVLTLCLPPTDELFMKNPQSTADWLTAKQLSWNNSHNDLGIQLALAFCWKSLIFSLNDLLYWPCHLFKYGYFRSWIRFSFPLPTEVRRLLGPWIACPMFWGKVIFWVFIKVIWQSAGLQW